ncbi:hypothetical protein H8958_009574 [Nasalis larvatus]
MDVTGGAGGGICPAAFLPLLLLLKRPARWRDLALAHLGTDVRARLAGMLDSPPQRCDRNNVQTVGSAGRSRKLPGGGVSGQQGKKGAAEERQKNWVLVQKRKQRPRRAKWHTQGHVQCEEQNSPPDLLGSKSGPSGDTTEAEDVGEFQPRPAAHSAREERCGRGGNSHQKPGACSKQRCQEMNRTWGPSSRPTLCPWLPATFHSRCSLQGNRES